jgi:hypothetical protein
MIADELGTAALMEKNKLYLDVVVPAIIDIGVPVFTHAERMRGGLRDF